MLEHPRPGIYLRQVDVPGVHDKFIEAHRVVLSELVGCARSAARWLARSELHDWGDIDTHGLAILDPLRLGFLHAASLPMDRAT